MDKLTGLRQAARQIFQTALRAADPVEAVLRQVRLREGVLCVGSIDYFLNQFRGIYLLGAGKASARMALALEQLLGDRVTGGVVITPPGRKERLRRVEVREAGHPFSDAAGVRATEELLALAAKAGENELVICLISGGGSALLAGPAEGLSLEEVVATDRLLLGSGLPIGEVNTVRRQLSRVKGGRLAAAVFPATLVTLILSDVIGDRLEVIASGPTAPDPTSPADALAVLSRGGLLERVPAAVRGRLERGAQAKAADDRPGEAIFARVHNLIVGSNTISLEAAEHSARRLGMNPLILSSTVEGEAREIARFYVALAREMHFNRRPLAPPACLIAGGEPTVTVRGKGQGGRSQELALAVALGLAEVPGAVFLAGGTDGADGPTNAAGAVAATDTLERASAMGFDARTYLQDNNSHAFFTALDDLLVTGPTGTNVMDVHLLLVG